MTTQTDMFSKLEAMLKPMTQAQSALVYMQKYGSITALDALNDFGCFRLAARISDLRADGYNITSKRFRTPGGATIARYSLA